jgi:hypothetical protein
MFSFYFLGFKKILSFLKKAFIVLAVYFIVISLFLHFINKDKPKVTFNPVEKNRQEIYKVINDPKLKNTKEGQITIALYRGMLCGLIGEACTDNPKDGEKNFNHSLFGFMTNLIVLPYANPPASGVYWAYSGLQNAGFVPKTYAAEGIGFAAIKPFMSIWKVFRDISYMLLVLVLIAIGFMIMFRTKINPQTVISVENSLPKIVVALLLITFSFPIAGFLIDLMYVVILIAISVLSNLNIGNLTSTNQSKLFLDYTNNGFSQLWPQGINLIQLGDGLLNVLGTTLKRWLYATIGFILGIIFSNAFMNLNFMKSLSEWASFEGVNIGTAVVNIGVGKFFAGIIRIIFFIIISFIFSPIALPFLISLCVVFTIIFLMFRIFFILLTSYIKIIFYIILSPLLLILEAVPGKNSFSSWFKNLLGEIFTFPLVIIIFLIGYALTQQSTNKGVWTPPFLYSIDPSLFPTFIGLGIVLITPDLIKLFKESIGAKGMGVEIGLGTFFGGLGAAWGGAQAGLGMFSSFAQFPLIGPWLHEQAREGKGALGPFLKNMLGPSQAELFAKELEKRGIGKSSP